MSETKKLPTAKTYLIIFAWLAFLTLLEIAGTWVPMPKAAFAIFLVATALAKVTLIVLFFMHLKFESWLVWLLPVIPLIFAAYFVLMIFPDIVHHLVHVFK